MIQTLQVTLLGATMGKGDYEGTDYDYTKIFVLMPLDVSTGNSLGSTAVEYRYGKSSNFAQFQGKRFPLLVDIDFLDVATSKGVARRVVQAVRAVNSTAPASSVKAA